MTSRPGWRMAWLVTDVGIPEEEEEASRAFAGAPASIADHSCCLTSGGSGPFSWTTVPATAMTPPPTTVARW
jgi:hypothetical protein